jgi:UDP-GlcNAc:undecaprenyl-phosphate GlcNAc-1-phosphate transferase
MTGSITLALAFVLALAIAPAVARLPGLVALPMPDRWHARTTPVTGGIALFAAVLISLQPALAQGSVPAGYVPLVLAVSAAFVLGLWDDVRALPPRLKLAGQAAVAVGAAAGGVHPDWLPVWAAIPLAIVVLVCAMNALNLLDHVDGLAAGTAAIAALALAAVAGIVGPSGSATVPLAVAGACLGFLPWNYRRRRPALLFMGDAGSHLLGAALGGLVLLSAPGGAGGSAVAAPLLILAIPLLDAVLVTLVRLAEGRPVSQGGRDHSSHRLVYAGLEAHRAVALLLAIAATSATAAVVVVAVDDALLALAAAGVAFAALVLFGVRLAKIDAGGHQAAQVVPLRPPAAGREHGDAHTG